MKHVKQGRFHKFLPDLVFPLGYHPQNHASSFCGSFLCWGSVIEVACLRVFLGPPVSLIGGVDKWSTYRSKAFFKNISTKINVILSLNAAYCIHKLWTDASELLASFFFFFVCSSISPSIRAELVFNVPSARPSQIVSCKRVGLISRTDSWPHSFPTQSSPCLLFQTELFAFLLIEPNLSVIQT